MYSWQVAFSMARTVLAGCSIIYLVESSPHELCGNLVFGTVACPRTYAPYKHSESRPRSVRSKGGRLEATWARQGEPISGQKRTP